MMTVYHLLRPCYVRRCALYTLALLFLQPPCKATGTINMPIAQMKKLWYKEANLLDVRLLVNGRACT